MPSVRSAVWSCIRPGRNVTSARVRPRSSLILVNLMVFCFFLPDTNARRPGRPAFGRRTWISLPSGPQPDAAGGGVGEYVRQRVQPGAGRGGITPPGQQRADLAHGAGDRGPVHAIHHRQRGVRDLQTQHRQRDQHPVGEHQAGPRPAPAARRPVTAAALPQAGLAAALPRPGEFGDQPAQVVTGDPDEGRMAQGRTGPGLLRHQFMVLCGPLLSERPTRRDYQVSASARRYCAPRRYQRLRRRPRLAKTCTAPGPIMG